MTIIARAHGASSRGSISLVTRPTDPDSGSNVCDVCSAANKDR